MNALSICRSCEGKGCTQCVQDPPVPASISTSATVAPTSSLFSSVVGGGGATAVCTALTDILFLGVMNGFLMALWIGGLVQSLVNVETCILSVAIQNDEMYVITHRDINT